MSAAVVDRTGGSDGPNDGSVIDRSAEVEAMRKRENWIRRLPLLPALIFTIIVTQVPFLFSLYYSLTRWDPTSGSPREFIGIDNYSRLIEPIGKFFREALWISALMTVASVILSLLVGLGLALLLDRKVFGQGFLRTLLITPFLIMPVVAAQVWSTQLLAPTFGVINWLLDTVGFERISFVSNYPVWSIIVVLVWQWSPFMMLILLAGLQGQDSSVLEAAKVDGATSFGIFRQITLPQLRPYMELSLLLGSIYLIQVFDHVQIMTRGRGSKNVPAFVAQESIGGGWRFGQASTYSVVVVLITIVLATFGLRTLSGLLEGEEAA